ncbi:uncharacterized protein LOC110448150 [Mizuhopecten yessoensis]|uniref:Uncharacterized protein n=1 Tax=Mizuhopecten yessoensis TaxID=6573 RepID=A0A210R631_MIZYE|nr:uncharacterized protein LOC110448150 [Mizuhopecten yessoensis]XP_021349922.1 uncharacterized protein LOC110448150 [Mizuhopecten yessoensis]OWF56364.1 hypothetical protein KP79_PYT14410 [Mizuhopecten yessoensis]
MMFSRNNGDTCTNRRTLVTLCAVSFLSTFVFLYLHSSITVQTFAIEKELRGTVQNMAQWRDKIVDWVQMLENVTTKPRTRRHGQLYRNETNHSVLDNRTTTDSPVKVFTTPGILLTLFTTWPTRADKYTCHNNTVENWRTFKPNIRPMLFTNEDYLAREVTKKGWSSLPIRQEHFGIPVLKFMYTDAMKVSQSQFYAYANGDILFTSTLIKTLTAVVNSTVIPNDKPIMIVGRRTNVQDVSVSEANSLTNVSKAARKRGKLFSAWAEDYFVTTENYPWKDIPEVVIGRRAYDNWLVLNARKHNHTTIDATLTLLALHQTTKAGNHEGHKATHSEYNHSLLSRLYKRLNYAAGLTSCAEYLTRYDNAMNIKVERRIKTC